MSESCKNYYKICRENAELNQDYAAGALAVSVRTLSDYENDKLPVPDDIVDRMCQLYDTRYLAMWHLKNKSRLGQYLPDFFEPQTIGDMMFSFALAQDGVSEAYDSIRKIFSDRKLSADEMPAMSTAVEVAREALKNLNSIVLYAEQKIDEVHHKGDMQDR